MIEIAKYYIRDEEVPLNKLKPNPKNPRKHPEDLLKKLTASITKFGPVVPIIVDEDYNILAGHARLKAAQRLGMQSFPVRVFKFTSQLGELFMLADNKIAELSEWDNFLLAEMFEALEYADASLEITGFDSFEIDEILETLKEREEEEFNVDNALEEIEEPITKRGDVWQLDKHKLICGDATNSQDMANLLGKEQPDMIFIDPPFDFETESMKQYVKAMQGSISDANIFTMHQDARLIDYLISSPFDFVRFFVCVYPRTMGHSSTAYIRHVLVSHERVGNPVSYQNLHDAFCSVMEIEYRGTIQEETVHKHQKSTNDIIQFITHYSKRGQIVCDTFAGSGTTLMACETSNRIARVMEIEPKYCDVIVNRWEKRTGKKALIVKQSTESKEKVY